MEKFWYKCGAVADDGFEAPMELTKNEAVIIAEFLKRLKSKNKWAEYCGSTWIDMSKTFLTEEECWEYCRNETRSNDDDTVD